MNLKNLIQLIPSAWENKEKILEGVVNSVKLEHNLLSEDEQEEIIRRRIICESCPLNSINAKISEEYKKLFGENYSNDRKDLHCAVCSCNVKLKTSSLGSNCGLTYYNENNPENKQELKWKTYEKQ